MPWFSKSNIKILPNHKNSKLNYENRGKCVFILFSISANFHLHRYVIYIYVSVFEDFWHFHKLRRVHTQEWYITQKASEKKDWRIKKIIKLSKVSFSDVKRSINKIIISDWGGIIFHYYFFNLMMYFYYYFFLLDVKNVLSISKIIWKYVEINEKLKTT